ncbi:MAG TPA: hypothetical protein VM925_25375 [Labilithrix sp.]|nr:hypothetical protein [Labilithrix sp.]
MANKVVHLPMAGGTFQTLRRDNWWVGPLVTFVVLSGFVVYATLRAFEGAHYTWGPYLSPLASPYFETHDLGIPLLTPAILILPFPGLFRFTCYYYRKAYYRSFGLLPPACAVGARNKSHYNGERKLLVFQNLHRYALYFALLFLVFLWHDFARSLSWEGELGFGLGSLVLFLNCAFLTLYTLSCHSFRHLVGGSVNSFSTARLGSLRHRLWTSASRLNVNHMAFAWISLFGVVLCDAYIRSLSTGAVHDVRLL